MESSGAPGERLGIGRTAEVYAWWDGQIVKLLRPGFPESIGEREAVIAARVTASDLAAPRFIGVERIDGRYGLVYERLTGPSMLERLTTRPWLVDGLARQFAELHAQMHETNGVGLPDHVASVRSALDRAAAALGAVRLAAALARLEGLAPGAAVCHGDMHPGNVILASSGPIAIDWLTAGAGPAEADLARSLYLLTDSAVPGVYARPQRAVLDILRRRFAKVYFGAYRKLRPVDDLQLQGWRLPVLAARLAEDITAERDALLTRIDAELTASAT